MSLGRPYPAQGRMALLEAVAAAAAAASAAAAELGYIGQSEGEPVVVEFSTELVGAGPGKHQRLSEAEPVECQPAGELTLASKPKDYLVNT